MRTRILLAIVATTALACIVLTLPLAVFGARREHERTVSEMNLEAQEVLIHLLRDGQFDPDTVTVPDVDWNIEVGVYSPSGDRIAGVGPDRADYVTDRAVFLPTNERIDGAVVLAQPVVLRGETVATLRLTEDIPLTGRRITRLLLALTAFDAAAVAFAALVGYIVAGRLARPVQSLRDDAVRLGTGDFAISPSHSGIREIDETSLALSDTASRLGTTLQREREFTSNASHQLRTPLTSLRIALEGELVAPRPEPHEVLAEALDEVDRLNATISTMLDVARGAPTPRDALDLVEWSEEFESRWVARNSGQISVHTATSKGSCHVSRAVLDQVCDVLVTNAFEHGVGPVVVVADTTSGRLVVSVSDDGQLTRDPSELFRRNDPDAAGHGVGLALARSLAEGEGGRLVVESIAPTTFRLTLPPHRPVASTP